VPDEDGYPLEEELKRIREWPWEKSDWDGLLEFVKTIWWAPDWGWHNGIVEDWITEASMKRYQISTGGWSGNESIIGALHLNHMFWMFCWKQSRVGGHYIFEVPQPND